MEWITPDWKAPKHVKAFASTRIGGCSLAPYDVITSYSIHYTKLYDSFDEIGWRAFPYQAVNSYRLALLALLFGYRR